MATLEERRKAAQAQIDANKRKAEEAAEERAVVLLEVRARFEGEIGPIGERWVLVDAQHLGPVVLKLGANVLHKAFLASIDKEKAKAGGPHADGITPEAAIRFVRPCIAYPEIGTWDALAEEAPGLVLVCAGALAGLYNAAAEVERGK